MELSNRRNPAYPNRGVTFIDRYVVIHGIEEGCGVPIFGSLQPSNLFPPNASQIEIFGHVWNLFHIINGDRLHNPSFVYRCSYPTCGARIICDQRTQFPTWETAIFIGTHEHRPYAPASPWEPIIVMTDEVFHSDYIRRTVGFASRTVPSPWHHINLLQSVSESNFASPHQGSYGAPRNGHGGPLNPTFVPTTVVPSVTLGMSFENPTTVRGESVSHTPHRRNPYGAIGDHLNRKPSISNVMKQLLPNPSLAQLFGNWRQLAHDQTPFSLFEQQPESYFMGGSRRENAAAQEGGNERSSSSSAPGEGGRNPEAHNTEFHDGRVENRSAQQREADDAEETVEGGEKRGEFGLA